MRQGRRRVVLLGSAGWLFLDLARLGTSVEARNGFTCAVSHVHDGDTLRCADGTRVRLHAIAAREIDGSCRPGHPCPQASGAEAKRALEALALDETLMCEATGLTYGRVAALCWTQAGVELSCAMVEGGYAMRWERYDRERRICA